MRADLVHRVLAHVVGPCLHRRSDAVDGEVAEASLDEAVAGVWLLLEAWPRSLATLGSQDLRSARAVSVLRGRDLYDLAVATSTAATLTLASARRCLLVL